MKIAIGNDHRGAHLKEKILQKFKKYTIKDVGCRSEENVDYPDYSERVSEMVSKGDVDRGILICGTGIGMSISANKFLGVRAAMVWDPKVAELTRQHNDSNVLCLAGEFLDDQKAFEIIETWLKTPFEGGRHLRRVDKIREQEKRHLKKKS